jgi:hypothetical protein
MKVIVATEKATGTRYGYCKNSGVDWFAPGLTSLNVAKLPQSKAEERIRELRLQELVRLFRKEKDGVATDCETVNLHGFTLSTEDPLT